jgi:hypothetical protein
VEELGRGWGRSCHTFSVPDTAVLGTIDVRRDGGDLSPTLDTVADMRKGRSHHVSLHVPDPAMLRTIKGRCYHTSSHLHSPPDKKAKIELAVDTLKEKKKATPKVRLSCLVLKATPRGR